MATRKKSAALATLEKDVSSSTLAKAGVEVKLTKGEIAEYIANKAQKRIQQEIRELEKDARNGIAIRVTEVPKRLRPIIAALNTVAIEHPFALYATAQHYGYNDDENRVHYVISPEKPENGWLRGQSNTLSFKIAEGEEIPAEVQTFVERSKRLTALYSKFNELREKNYKVLLVESILSGSTAGATVLTDLNKMVDDMVQSV